MRKKRKLDKKSNTPDVVTTYGPTDSEGGNI